MCIFCSSRWIPHLSLADGRLEDRRRELCEFGAETCEAANLGNSDRQFEWRFSVSQRSDASRLEQDGRQFADDTFKYIFGTLNLLFNEISRNVLSQLNKRA